MPDTPVKLTPGQSVVTKTATLLVAALPAGTYKFQLDITDVTGATSRAAITVRVVAIG